MEEKERSDLEASSSIETTEKKGIDRRSFLAIAGMAGVTLCNIPKASGESCLACHSQAPATFQVEAATKDLMAHARSLGIDLIWDRGSPCENAHKGDGGAAGLCCFRCQMGPCTLGAATGAERGTCGATRDVIACRDLVRRIAGGAASHAEHARAVAKVLKAVAAGSITGYGIADSAKLNAIYNGLGLSGATTDKAKALAVAKVSLQDLAKDEGIPAWLRYKASAERKATWGKL